MNKLVCGECENCKKYECFNRETNEQPGDGSSYTTVKCQTFDCNTMLRVLKVNQRVFNNRHFCINCWDIIYRLRDFLKRKNPEWSLDQCEEKSLEQLSAKELPKEKDGTTAI